jgi:hypothetical protein
MRENDIALLSLVSNILGAVNTVVISLWLDKKRNYKKTFIFLGLIMLISQIILAITCEVCKDHFTMLNVFVFIFYSINQACILPMFSSVFDYACELCYPIGEGNAIGIMVSAGAVMSLATVSLILILLDTWV